MIISNSLPESVYGQLLGLEGAKPNGQLSETHGGRKVQDLPHAPDDAGVGSLREARHLLCLHLEEGFMSFESS